MRLHDYTKETLGWGHDYTYDPAPGGLTAHMAGWGTGIAEGDLICITGPTGKPCPLRVVSIRYELDPPDMWFADVAYDAAAYRSLLAALPAPVLATCSSFDAVVRAVDRSEEEKVR